MTMKIQSGRTTKRSKQRLMTFTALCAFGVPLMLNASNASAQAGRTQASVYEFDLPAQSLAQSITQAAATAGVQVLYGDEESSRIKVGALKGRMSLDEALARLLSGTGFTFRYERPGLVTLTKLPDTGGNGDGERLLGAVRVEGGPGGAYNLAGATAANGINGSRDVTATEGTGSYTSNALTIGSKTAATIKDTPASVSVLTNQQMQDQNITDLNSAMRNLPGVTLVHSGTGQYDFYSRGFQITQYQFDGGAAMMGGPLQGGFNGYHPIIDMSLYDHVEVVRGAAGTFNAYGSPGGVVNLARKKPLDHNQILVEGQVGSWDWYRGSIDITGPLAFDGRLRGRAIFTHQDNKFFYDIAKANLTLGSATLEYDLTPSTLVSVGFNYQDSYNLPFTNGLMRYQDGRSLDLPRSTCFCFGFARDKANSLDLFGQIEHSIGEIWRLKLKVTRSKQEGDFFSASVRNSVDPYTLAGAQVFIDDTNFPRVRQTMIEATLDGYFRLFGQDQKLVIGANYSMQDASGSSSQTSQNPLTGEFPFFPGKISNDVNVFDFNYREWMSPAFPKYDSLRYLFSDSRVLNAYVNLELSPVRKFHITTGIRYAKSRNRFLYSNLCVVDWVQYGICTNPGEQFFSSSGDSVGGGDISWPPSVQARYDITDNLTASAIYTDIYVDQSRYLARDNKPIPPITGQNFEGMLKWASPDRRINVTLSGFYIRQIGNAKRDCGLSGAPACTDESTPAQPGQLSARASCCYIFNPDYQRVSYGSDFEISGEIRKGWQISASYVYNRNYYDSGFFAFDGSRDPLISYAPRHKFQMWTTYSFDGESAVHGLTLGFGVKIQSSTFTADYYCAAYSPNPSTGVMQCTQGKPVNFTDPGRAVFSGSVDYKINKNISANLSLENLLDKTYYEQVGGIGYGNWYGAPRNAKLTIRGKF
jgi:outer-membrane receptor for ferric coprogen and ferric-rhodotorulic acid